MAIQSSAQVGDVRASVLAGLLNAVLRNQFTSTNQVFLNAFILEHWGFHLCAERMYLESVGETRRSMRSLRHLTLLGLEPDLAGSTGPYSMARPVVGRELGEVFRIEKRHAEQSLGVANMAIAAYEAADDTATLEFFRQAARGQAEYVSWLAAQTAALRDMGDARYREAQGAALRDGDLKAFLRKVKELRARDPDFPDEPRAADETKEHVDDRVLAGMNNLLGAEIMSIERNFVDAFIFDRRGDQSLTDRIALEALASMRRAQRITEHILALGEVPAPGAHPSVETEPGPGGAIRNYLDAEQRLEELKIRIIREARSSADLRPGATSSLFAGMLRQYERRVEWLASLIRDGSMSKAEASATPGTFQAMLRRWDVPA